MGDPAIWQRFKQHLLVCEPVGVSIDVSRMRFGDTFLAERDADIRRAFTDMEALEAGAIANPDEHRMVGHYWLRDSARAPTPEIRKAIDTCLAAIKRFARDVHAGRVKPPRARRFTRV